MVIKAFPPLESADSNGLLAIGGDLEVNSLLLAYKHGIFPWPIEDEMLAWFCPPRRAILNFDKFHISHSLKKAQRKAVFKFTINKAFEQVVEGCRSLENRKIGQGTWINDDIVNAYCNLHKKNYAYSIEAWNNDKLAGGIYGVSIGGFVGGESMFYREANASKLAICFLVETFKHSGFEWIDCQVMTPHMKTFGAEMISRKIFVQLLEKSLAKKTTPLPYFN